MLMKPATAREIMEEAAAYRKAHPFLLELNRARDWIGRDQYSTLRRMALDGDLDGAVKGLAKLMGRRIC